MSRESPYREKSKLKRHGGKKTKEGLTQWKEGNHSKNRRGEEAGEGERRRASN